MENAAEPALEKAAATPEGQVRRGRRAKDGQKELLVVKGEDEDEEDGSLEKDTKEDKAIGSLEKDTSRKKNKKPIIVLDWHNTIEKQNRVSFQNEKALNKLMDYADLHIVSYGESQWRMKSTSRSRSCSAPAPERNSRGPLLL